MAGDRHGHGREAGFTLMEILISMTILMVGLLPMLAVFKTALNNLNRAIEDTYAASIAQSVIDSIRLGLKDMKVEQDGGTTRFFIFDHDGVENLEEDRRGMLRDMDITLPQDKAQLLPRDYVILLPNEGEIDAEQPTGAGAGGVPVGKAFLYPRKNAGDNASRRGVAYVKKKFTTPDGKEVETRKVEIEKVFKLGQKLKESQLKVEQEDTYSQYSFAFTIRTAKAPDPNAPNTNPDWIQRLKQQSRLGGLYEVVVRVFRNFNPDPNHKRNETVGGPGREFITFVAE